MDKETFCRQLCMTCDSSDDDKGDEVASLLREYRQKRILKPPGSSVYLSATRNETHELTTNSLQTTSTAVGNPSNVSPEEVANFPEMGRANRSSRRRSAESNLLLRSKKARKSSSSFSVPKSRQIFKGLVFFFIPNDDVSPSRRMRIQRSVEFGARRATKWCTEITHVIVDKGLTVADVMKYLKIDSILTSMLLVNETYPVVCISKGTILEGGLQRFQVQGAAPPLEEHSSVQQSILRSESLLVKPTQRRKSPGTTPQESQGQNAVSAAVLVPSSDDQAQPDASAAHNDPLNEVIQTVKATAALVGYLLPPYLLSLKDDLTGQQAR